MRQAVTKQRHNKSPTMNRITGSIGIVDTTFARVDMGTMAENTIRREAPKVRIVRYTVPGIKDLPVAAKKLIEEHHCDIVLALGHVGGAAIDSKCAHEASMGIIQAQLMTNHHILGVMVFEAEASTPKQLSATMKDRTGKHARNAIAMLQGKDALRERAGTGRRQGAPDAGPI